MDSFPLHWPIGWPRTKPGDRKRGNFKRRGGSNAFGYRPLHNVTVAQAIQRIEDELRAMDGPSRHWTRIDPGKTVISTNLRVRKSDGGPASSQREPDDPGVAVYFELDGKMQCIPCDAYDNVAQNLAAVAATLNALRTLERHGSGIMERAFTGFEALPHLAESPWWEVLMVPADAPAEVVEKQYRRLRSDYHPDHGGSDYQFNRIQKAYEAWQKEQRR